MLQKANKPIISDKFVALEIGEVWHHCRCKKYKLLCIDAEANGVSPNTVYKK